MFLHFELDPKEEAVADLVAEVGKKLQRAVSLRKMSQNEIAQRLNVDRSRVNRCLSGFNNLTLRSIAELAWAMDAKISFKMDLLEADQTQRAIDPGTNVVGFPALGDQQTADFDPHELEFALAQ